MVYLLGVFLFVILEYERIIKKGEENGRVSSIFIQFPYLL